MAYNDDMLALVDQRIRAALKVDLATGTVSSRTPGDATAMVVFDGDNLAVPVKVGAGISVFPGTRVAMVHFGDWVVVASFATTSWLPYKSVQKLTGSVASVTFSDIPATLHSLQISWTARSSLAALADTLLLQFNGDGSGSYDCNYSQIKNATFQGPFGLATQTSVPVGMTGGSTAAANNFGAGTIDIPGWDLPHTANVNFTFAAHFYENLANSYYHFGGALYFAALGLTSITLFASGGNLVAGSEFVLTGVE
jgi:hypothetical protein